MSGTLAALLIVSTFIPGAPDSNAIVESWVGPTPHEFTVCADLAKQQNELFDYLFATGLNEHKAQGGRQKARCEAAFVEDRVKDVNQTIFNRAMTAPEMVPVNLKF